MAKGLKLGDLDKDRYLFDGFGRFRRAQKNSELRRGWWYDGTFGHYFFYKRGSITRALTAKQVKDLYGMPDYNKQPAYGIGLNLDRCEVEFVREMM